MATLSRMRVSCTPADPVFRILDRIEAASPITVRPEMNDALVHFRDRDCELTSRVLTALSIAIFYSAPSRRLLTTR
jgi:hypothetical protein